MRRISASFIFTGNGTVLPGGTVAVTGDGTITAVSGATDPEAEKFEGIICPGFINTHCHLELSHMRGKITEKSGMAGFIRELLSIRPAFSTEEILAGIQKADEEMFRNGIEAVGDISNDNSTFGQKGKSAITYHTFIESFDIDPSRTRQTFDNALKLKDELKKKRLKGSITPHAPYTVTHGLLDLIVAEANNDNSILSIHNQESEGENELFQDHSGSLFESFSRAGINMSNFPPTGKSSLLSIIPYLPTDQKVLFVHNTFTTADDLDELLKKRKQELSYFCTCPNANLYIENRLPDYQLFIQRDLKITIGTDSLASNHSLSVLDEIKTIRKHFPEIECSALLQWATMNGAEFLGLGNKGEIREGNKPGLLLITGNRDFDINESSSVKRII